MNLPNQLTLARIGLTFVMTVLLTAQSLPFGKTLALLVLAAAGLTDYWDGRLARTGKQETVFGKLMDPLADKILVCAAFVSLVALDQIVPAWIVVMILSREFVVTGLRLLAAGAGQVIGAGRWGKHKTAWQIVVIVAIMAGLALREDILPRVLAGEAREAAGRLFDRYFSLVTTGMSALVALLTVFTGGVYLWENRSLYAKDL